MENKVIKIKNKKIINKRYNYITEKKKIRFFKRLVKAKEMKKKETEAQARERRKKQYGCDGLCYGGMNDDGVMCQPCGGIDTCEETRYIEAFATWGAALVILLTPIAMVAGFVLLIVATVKGRI